MFHGTSMQLNQYTQVTGAIPREFAQWSCFTVRISSVNAEKV